MAQVAAVRITMVQAKLFAVFAAGACALVLMGAALVAVPALGQEAPSPAPRPKKPDTYRGVYVGGTLGYGLPSKIDLTTQFSDSTTRSKDEIDFDSGGVTGSVKAGYEYRFLRGEAELHTQLLIGNDVRVANPNTGSRSTHVDINGTRVFTTFFTNAFVEAPINLPVAPYVGGGIGVGVLATDDDADAAVAINGQAGVTWDLSPRIALDANYRYTHFGHMSLHTPNNTRTSFQNYDGHAFEFGVRYRFGNVTRPPPPRPVRPAMETSLNRTDYDFPTRSDPGPPRPVMPHDGAATPAGDRAPAFVIGTGVPDEGDLVRPRPTARPSSHAPLPLLSGGYPTPSPLLGQITGAAATSSRHAPSATSGHTVQLASFSSAENARQGWGRLTTRHGDLLSGLQPSVTVVDIPGKGRFHRLSASGLHESAARSLCQQLQQRGAGCRIVSR